MTTAIDHPLYNYKVVRQFAIMAVVTFIISLVRKG